VTALVNDVHSRLNPTAVLGVVQPRSLDELAAAVAGATARRPLALCGGRHSLGGQQFARGGVLGDTSALARVLSVDEQLGIVEAEAGIRWPALMDALRGTAWSIRQKQAGTNDATLGGTISANAHGRGLRLAPIAADVERLTVVCPDGNVRTCSRTRDPGLFRLVCGGYGLFGAVYAVALRLVPRRRFRHVAGMVQPGEAVAALGAQAAAGAHHGDVRLEIDPSSRGFLRRGVLSSYEPLGEEADRLAGTSVPAEDVDGLVRLAHADKARWFELISERARAAGDSVVDADAPHVASYVAGYHWPGSSEMLTELFVPRGVADSFLEEAARELRSREAGVVDATVRLVERDGETVFAWAREAWACVSIEIHVEHDAVAVGRTADACRGLIDTALSLGGSYHLAYHRWARRDQLEAAHPAIHDFVRAKRDHDPAGVLRSDWYRHLLRLLDVREAA